MTSTLIREPLIYMSQTTFESFEEAVEKANKYLDQCEEEGYPVEYGLDIQTRVSANSKDSLT